MINEKTVGKNIKLHAYRCGFVVKKIGVDLYTIYDTTMNYEIFRGSRYSAVQKIVDELNMVEYHKNNLSPVVGV